MSLIDHLCDVVIHDVKFDPLPYSSRMFIGATIDNHTTDIVPFVECDLSGERNIADAIENNSSERNAVYISTMNKIPAF